MYRQIETLSDKLGRKCLSLKRERAIRHFEMYRSSGYTLATDLIYTFEADVNNPERLAEIVNRILAM